MELNNDYINKLSTNNEINCPKILSNISLIPKPIINKNIPSPLILSVYSKSNFEIFNLSSLIENFKSKSTPNSLNNSIYDSSDEEYEIENNVNNDNAKYLRKEMMVINKNNQKIQRILSNGNKIEKNELNGEVKIRDLSDDDEYFLEEDDIGDEYDVLNIIQRNFQI
jgi:hypothetical protein